MKVANYMKTTVISISANASVQDAVQLMINHHIGTLPVIDEEQKLIGVVDLKRLLSLVMPDFVSMVENFDFLSDFGFFEQRMPSTDDLSRKVLEIMEKPKSVKVNSGLLHAAAVLNQHALKDLPVITEEGSLIGLVSHVDVGCALMSSWKK
jgi:CBS-domain-containing membrane protein